MISHSKPTISSLDFEKINTCLSSGNIANGSVVSDFAKELKLNCKAQESLVTNSGTSAIFLALKAVGIQQAEQEVLLPSYVCDSVCKAVIIAGGAPVFYDNGTDWIATYESITKKVSAKTAAIIVVHTLGIIMRDIKKVSSLNIPVIEDCCQCFGGEYEGEKVGFFGDLSVFSFQGTKCLTTGEGGAVLVNNQNYVAQVRKEYSSMQGLINFSNLQASLGLSQLLQYPEFLKRRKEIADIYFSSIKKDLTDSFRSTNSINYRFLLRIQDGDFAEIKQKFQAVGIAVRKGVDELLHQKYNLSDSEFPQATLDFNSTISIPIYPTITTQEAYFISEQVNNIL